MAFTLNWTNAAAEHFEEIKKAATAKPDRKLTAGKSNKSSKQEGLLKQVRKTLALLRNNPSHPGLNTHEYSGIQNPYNKNERVFEAYVQNKTPGAYRVFWCYGKQRGEITIIAITPHP